MNDSGTNDMTSTSSKPKVVDVPVVALNQLCDDGYELILERGGISLRPGQLINIHGRNRLEDRSYTVCSGIYDEYLTVLFKMVTDGILTPQLAELKPGASVCISGPYGEFVIRDTRRPNIFIATGTGVAPCRAYARSYDNLDMTLIHGVQYEKDLYYRDELQPLTYHACVSREPVEGLFHGRVTAFVEKQVFPENSHYYLCGANEMIYEIQELLAQRNIDPACIFTEAYYYRSND